MASRIEIDVGDAVLGLGALLLGAGAAAVALLGPLVFGVIRYHASTGAVRQVAGGDVAGLVLVAPVALIGGWLILRGRREGRALALGPSAYALYMYSQLAVGGDFSRYPGNSERYFALFLGLFIVAAGVFVGSWAGLRADRLRSVGRGLGRFVGWFALVVAAFLVFGLHLPGLLDVWRGAPSGSEVAADPVLFWLVKFMDLGLVVPILAAVGVALLRDRAWARAAVYGVTGWMALLGTSVAGMAVVMQAAGDPGSSWANVVAFGCFALIGLGVAAAAHAPLFRGGGALEREDNARLGPQRAP